MRHFLSILGVLSLAGCFAGAVAGLAAQDQARADAEKARRQQQVAYDSQMRQAAEQQRAFREDWVVTRERSPLDGSENVVAMKRATAPITVYDSTIYPVLVVRCEERRLRVGISTGNRFDKSYTAEVPLTVRIGTRPPVDVVAQVGTDRESAYFGDPVGVLAQLDAAEDVAIRWTPLAREARTMTVVMGKARETLAPITAACGSASAAR